MTFVYKYEQTRPLAAPPNNSYLLQMQIYQPLPEIMCIINITKDSIVTVFFFLVKNPKLKHSLKMTLLLRGRIGPNVVNLSIFKVVILK